MYTISWEVDFEYDLFEPRKENWTDVATPRPMDAESTNTDNDVTDEESAINESCSERTTRNYVTENERVSNESYNERTTEYDVTEDEISPRENNSSDEPSPPTQTSQRTENENDVTNDLQDTENVSNTGADITVPGISKNGNSNENSSPRGGKYNLRPNPTPNFTDEYRY